MSNNILNDKYWLDYAQNSVNNSTNTISQAAAKLESVTLWFWAAYTAVFTAGVTLNLLDAPKYVISLLASPVVLLIITYWLCNLAQMPLGGSYDPRIPSEIKNSYNKSVIQKQRRLNLALLSTFISAVMLSIALFQLSFYDKKENESVSTAFNSNKTKVIISGILPKGKIATVTIDSSLKQKGKSTLKKQTIFKNTVIIQNNGLINYNIPIKNIPDTIFISIAWREDKEEKGFYKILCKNEKK